MLMLLLIKIIQLYKKNTKNRISLDFLTLTVIKKFLYCWQKLEQAIWLSFLYILKNHALKIVYENFLELDIKFLSYF